MNYLRQSTASQSRAIGPFLDDTDFITPETGLTIANTDIKLVKNGGASADKNSGGGTHRVNGVYGLTFDATDTATVGELEVSVVVSGAVPVHKTFFVVEEAVYDVMYAANATGNVAAITAIQAKTDQLTFTTANVVDASATVSSISNSAIDSIFKRDLSAVSGEAARSLLNAVRFLRNRWFTSAGTLTVTKEDDTTTAWTASIVSTVGASPVTSIDPA